MSNATINLFGSPQWVTLFKNAKIVHGTLNSTTSYTVTDGAGDSLQFIGKNFKATDGLLSGGTITGFKMTLGKGGGEIASGKNYAFAASGVANALKLFQAGHKTALLNLFLDIATTIDGSSGDDTLVAPPGGGSVSGGGGFNTLNLGLLPYGHGAVVQESGAGQKVTINGKTTLVTGVERIIGTALADTMHAAGAVDLIGGAGADTFIGDPTRALTVDYLNEEFTHPGSPGTKGVTVNLSSVTQGAQAAGTATDTYGDTDTYVSVGACTIWGTNANDKLYAGSSATKFFGFGGNDTLVGGAGADYLSGGDGNDHLIAGSGATTLDGGAGNDKLTGGAGHDVFVFEAGFGKDTITDFTAGPGSSHDFISISKSLFSSASDVLSHTTALDSSHCIIKYDANDTITIDVAKSALNASDFKFV